MKKIFKHISVLIICTLLAVCIMPITASAQSEYTDGGTCGDNVIWTLYDTNVDGKGDYLTISGEGDMTDHPWLKYDADIRTVVIKEGVTSVAKYAFYGCTSLVSVTIPEGVTSVGDYAFAMCSSLTDIIIPEGVTSVGNYAFARCKSLANITIPEGVKSIGDYAFYICDSLSGVTIPKGVTCIGNYVFYRCKSLSRVTIPKGVTCIGESAFSECDSLTSITIPYLVTVMKQNAFYSCKSLASITIPESIAAIGEYAFWGCSSLRDVYYTGTEETWKNISVGTENTNLENAKIHYIEDNDTYEGLTLVAGGDCGRNVIWKLYDTDFDHKGDELVISGAGNMTNFEYDDSTQRTNVPWINYIEHIKTVVVKKGVTSVGDEAFSECISLTNIKIPAGVTYIGYFAFFNCESLTDITIPESVTQIGEGVFGGCVSLTSITIPEGVSSVGDYAFAWCESLTSITIPESVTQIGEDAFYDCVSLADIYYAGTEEKWKGISIDEGNYCFAYAKIHCRPAAPTNVKATNVASSGKIKLTWSAVTGASKYEVYRATSKTGTYTKLTTTTGTSITNTKVTAGKLYYYKVVALDANGNESEASAIVSRRADLPQVTNLKATNVASSGKIKLTWDAVDGAEKYEVYRATSKAGEYTRLTTTTGTSITNTKVTAGKTYYYKVVAVHSNTNANSAYSAAVSRTCDLAQVTGVKATNVSSSGKIKLTWDAVTGASKYEVYRSTSKAGEYTRLTTTTGTSITNTKVTAGKTYYYKVRALHTSSAATGAYSTVASRMCDLARPEVTVSYSSGGKPKLSWNKVEGAVKYEIYRSKTGKSGSFSKIYTATKTTFTNTSAVAGTKYYYKVVAVHSNTNANSAYSLVKSITSK